MSDVKERVIKVAADRLKVATDEIDESKAFQADLGADSLDMVDLVQGFEVEFEISISDEDAMKVKTVGDAVTYIEDHINQ